MISTKDQVPNKAEILKELRKFHQPVLDKLEVPNAVFIPKMAYRPYGKTEVHIACFPSEINKGEDVYIEFCSKDWIPEDPHRRLYKWRFNPHYQEEYDTTEPNPQTGHVRYLIPVGELIVVSVNNPEETLSDSDKNNMSQEFNLPDANVDLPMDQMTIRDYAAIHLKKPVSMKPWLNDLISK